MTTSIEWTHVPGYRGETWNPVRGCTKISPGCKHCYAATFAERWRNVPGHPYEQGFDLRLVHDKLEEPLQTRPPRAYFVNSMSDLHQDDVPFEFVRQAYAVMERASQHLFMVLTKRAENLHTAITTMRAEAEAVDSDQWPQVDIDSREEGIVWGLDWPFKRGTPPNVWLGVSVEDRRFGLPRIDVLRLVPAAVRFLSIEPLLEDLGPLDLRGIDWVIVGGESGLNARPMRPEWVLSIRDQCVEQGVAFFFKQWGGVNKKKAGRVLDGRTHDDFPEVRRAA